MRARVWAFYRRHHLEAQVVLGLALAVIGGYAIKLGSDIRSQGTRTETIVSDGQQSRFDNTVAACLTRSEERRNHNRFWLIIARLSDPDLPQSRIDFFNGGLEAYFPEEPECLFDAYRKVCVGAIRTTNARCLQYARAHDVEAAQRRYDARQAKIKRDKAAFLAALEPGT